MVTSSNNKTHPVTCPNRQNMIQSPPTHERGGEMSNTNKKPKDQTITTYRSFTLPNPPHDQLNPIYTPLQNLLNTTLTKPKYRNQILQLNPKQPRGQY